MKRHPFIISVGNLAMGGTGKTPFTIMLAKYFSSAGEKVSILSRGYRGKLGYDTAVISDGENLLYHPPQAADEPYMMAKALIKDKVVVITGKDRTESLKTAEETYSSSVCILDDGFQYHKLVKDVDILLLDYKKPISTGFPFPLGYLREFPFSIKRADVVVFTRADSTDIPAKVKKYCINKPTFFCEHVYSGFYHKKERDLEYIIGKKAWLMSGIANQSQFRKQVEDMGLAVLGATKYNDHHMYSYDDIDKVLKSAAKNNADFIITTEKDMVKIPEGLRDNFCYPMLTINMLNPGLFEYLATRFNA